MTTRAAVTATALILFAAGAAQAAGEKTNVRGVGMARATTASARGLDAVGINPAGLALDDGTTVTFSLAPASVHVGSDFLTYGLYDKFFTGVETDSGLVARHLTAADKEEILSAFPSGLGNLAADAEIRPLGLAVRMGSWGTFALTLTERVAGRAAIPDAYARFLFYGNTPGSDYDFSGTSASAEWTREYALTYARTIPDLWLFSDVKAGVAVKVIHGFAHLDVQRFGTRLVTGTDGILHGNVDVLVRKANSDMLEDDKESDSESGRESGRHSKEFDPFSAPAGTGMGFDLGMTGNLGDAITIGVSVTDIGSVRWTRNVKEAYSNASLTVDNPLDEGQRDSLENAVQGDSRPGEEFTSSLPTMLRLGGSVELHALRPFKKFLFGEMTVACDVQLPLADAAGTVRAARAALGLEYRPWGFLPIRTGVAFGGPDRFNYAVGFGFHIVVFDIDFASENLGWLFSQDSFSYGSVAVGMKFRF